MSDEKQGTRLGATYAETTVSRPESDIAKLAYETYMRRMYGADVFTRTTRKTFEQLDSHTVAVWRDVASAVIDAAIRFVETIQEATKER